MRETTAFEAKTKVTVYFGFVPPATDGLVPVER